MSGGRPDYGIDITANDRTSRGARSAERRLSQIPRHMAEAARRQRAAEERLSRQRDRESRKRLSEIRDVARATADYGNGTGSAARAATALSEAMRSMGGRTGGWVAGILDTVKEVAQIADGWNKSALSIRNAASAYGVGAKALQTFSAAAERAGVDKNTASGAIGSLSQTLNDAKYGRNPQAREVLRRLGVGMKLNQDGTVNVEAMLPAIADAITRQNSSGRRTAARHLGIPEAALPAFTQGGGALAREMRDAEGTSHVYSEEQLARAAKRERDVVRASQWGMRYVNKVGELASDGLDVAVGDPNGGAGIGGNGSAPAGGSGRSGMGGRGSVSRSGGASGLRNGTLNLTNQDIIDLKKTLATEWVTSAGANQGRGIIDTILNRQASGHWGSSIADVVNARKQFSDVNGPVAWRHGRHSVSDIPMSRVSKRASDLVDTYLAERARGRESIVGDNLNYANPAYSDARNQAWIRKLKGPVLGRGNASHRHGTTDDLQRYRPGDYDVGIPVRVTVELVNAPAGTRATVQAGGGAAPAVSQAMQR